MRIIQRMVRVVSIFGSEACARWQLMHCCWQSFAKYVQGVGHSSGGPWLQVEDEEVKKLLASSIKSKKKNKPKKKRAAHAANGAEGDKIVKEKELEEAREGIRAL